MGYCEYRNNFEVNMGEGYKNITNEMVASTYAKKAANVSATCTALGITRMTFYNWRKNREGLDEALSDVEESLLDFTESKLLEQIQEGNLTAIIFHLKTKGKNRGYVERTENELSINPFEDLMKSIPDE